ncbi:MAG: hypothetical protein ACP5UA_10030 [Candidatus Hydrogenedens sp.]
MDIKIIIPTVPIISTRRDNQFTSVNSVFNYDDYHTFPIAKMVIAR